MTAAEVAEFRKRPDLVGADKIALKWYDKTLRMNDDSGPKLLDMAMDRTEGKVAQVHKVEDITPRAELSDEKLDEIWKRRQSRTKPSS